MGSETEQPCETGDGGCPQGPSSGADVREKEAQVGGGKAQGPA